MSGDYTKNTKGAPCHAGSPLENLKLPNTRMMVNLQNAMSFDGRSMMCRVLYKVKGQGRVVITGRLHHDLYDNSSH